MGYFQSLTHGITWEYNIQNLTVKMPSYDISRSKQIDKNRKNTDTDTVVTEKCEKFKLC